MTEIKPISILSPSKSVFDVMDSFSVPSVAIHFSGISVSLLYVIFGICGLVSVALIYHWFRYGLSGVFAVVVTIVYGFGTLSLFGYLLSVVITK